MSNPFQKKDKKECKNVAVCHGRDERTFWLHVAACCHAILKPWGESPSVIARVCHSHSHLDFDLRSCDHEFNLAKRSETCAYNATELWEILCLQRIVHVMHGTTLNMHSGFIRLHQPFSIHSCIQVDRLQEYACIINPAEDPKSVRYQSGERSGAICCCCCCCCCDIF